jgi:hypothetical protein
MFACPVGYSTCILPYHTLDEYNGSWIAVLRTWVVLGLFKRMIVGKSGHLLKPGHVSRLAFVI